MTHIPLALIIALITVESNGDDLAIGDNGRALGCLQIHKEVVEDCNRISDRLFDRVFLLKHRASRDRSIEMCQLYLSYYASKDRIGRDPTIEDMARIWNGGPKGWKKDSTKAYWEKVRSHITTEAKGAVLVGEERNYFIDQPKLDNKYSRLNFSDPVPDNLRLRPDGTLYCADGGDVEELLAGLYQRANRGILDDMPVCVLHRETLAILCEEAFIGRNMGV